MIMTQRFLGIMFIIDFLVANITLILCGFISSIIVVVTASYAISLISMIVWCLLILEIIILIGIVGYNSFYCGISDELSSEINDYHNTPESTHHLLDNICIIVDKSSSSLNMNSFDIQNECPICLDNFEVKNMFYQCKTCSKNFHSRCFIQHTLITINDVIKCPTCNMPINTNISISE